MTNSEFLTYLVNQKISTIIGLSLDAKGFVDHLKFNDTHLDSLEFTCVIDGDRLCFINDYPDNENESMFYISIDYSIRFIQILINEIYHNKQMQEQLN